MKTAVLDIGGTSIKAGIWTENSIKYFKEFPTNALGGGKLLMKRIISILEDYGEFDRIGVSTAGQVDSEKGIIRYANANIPGYTGMPIRDLLMRHFHVPIAVENDVNAAAVGEASLGAGCKEQDFLCLTYGTGIGGAIVMNHKIYKGSAFSAGEFGSIIIHADKFKENNIFAGSYEHFASTSALIKMIKEYNPRINNGKEVFEEISDPQIKQIVDHWITEIMYGLITLIYIFHPSCIIMGGGIMNQNYILEHLIPILYKNTMSSFHNVRLKKAQLGNCAGLIGAAYIASQLN